jgi:carbon monoxide dehydrogenase subunit G
MRLEQSFEVAAPLEQVWHTLIDVEHVAPCLPGAAVTGRNDDGSYNGTFTVKIGPTTASYTGRLEMENIDEASHTATMQAQGTDKRGQGGAKATILSRVAPIDGQGTRVDVVTDYHITGRLARFGRGGMIEDISARLLREFAKRLQTSLDTQPQTSAVPAAAAEPSRAETVVSSSSTPAEEPVAPVAPLEEPAAPAWAPPEPPPPAEDAAPGSTDAPAPFEPSHEPEPEPAVAHEPEPEPAVAHEPEPEPAVAHEPEPEPAVAPEPEPEPEPAVTAYVEPAMAEAAAHEPPPPHEPPPVAPPPPPPPPPPPLDNPPMPSEPMQGLSLVGSVVWGRVRRNPAPVAAAGVAVVLLMARRRRRRHH